jgi:hypothetical protein
MQHGLSVVISVSILALVSFAATAAVAPVFLDVIPLPTGFQPEDIVTPIQHLTHVTWAPALHNGLMVLGGLRSAIYLIAGRSLIFETIS